MRNESWHLLLSPLGIVLAGLALLYMVPNGEGLQSIESIGGLSCVLWLAGCVVLTVLIQWMLLHSTPPANPWLFPCAMLLTSVGLVMLARLKLELFPAQLKWLFIGLVIFLVMLRMKTKILRLTEYPYILGIGCVILLLLPLLFGTEIGGSRNWLLLGPIRVQPSEFGKILLVLFLAAYLSSHRHVLSLPNKEWLFLRMPPFRFIAPLLTIWSASVLMFVVARDLGSALLFFGIAVAMTYMATGNRSYVAMAVVFFGAAAVFSYMAFGHVRVRFDIWLDPWQDPAGMAYQVVQSLFAFGAGGVWGTGFAHGHPDMIPEVHTDFIFSAIAEEFGLVGALMVMSIYALFFYEGIRVALTRKSAAHMLLSAGAATVFFLQAFIIIAGVSKFLPLTGITMPFVSYGGSSMVSSFLLLGIIISVSRGEAG